MDESQRRIPVSHLRIPANWKVKRSTPFFTKETVPAALLTHHNTAAGVFGQLCVMEGTVTYYGFANEQATEPEVKVVINAGQFATSPPEYWHRVELSDDAQFNINFWVENDTQSDEMYHAKKA
jgi:tellurite resistance-related uncharacterized protein